MASNTNFSLSSIDPDSLKQSFITFLQSQNTFKDYNYSGPNINVLLDVLSRNSYLNSFYTNMAFAESQLDSAQLRDSVVSKAKELNYIPSSVTSSLGIINVSIVTTSGNSFELPLGTSFKGTNANGTYQFVTDKSYLSFSSNGTFNFSNVYIYDGSYINEAFVVDNSVNNQIFTLSNPSIDTSSLTILVSENQGSTNNYFEQAEGVYDLDGNSQVYYLQGTSNGQYEFLFGDGVLGYEPQNGAIVVANYRVANGISADGCNTYSLVYNLGTYNNTNISNITITTVSNSTNGSDAEDIESIRFNAPRAYQSQDRAVTSNDFRNLILRRFPQVGDVNVYGGNTTSTAVNYGKVFIAAVSQYGYPLTQTIKNEITLYISNVTMLPIKDSVKIVDPNTTFINITTNVHIDFTQTSYSPTFYNSLTANAIINFANSNLQKFNKPFFSSKLSDAIDAIDANNIILGNDTYYTVTKNIPISLNVNNNISFSFNNPIINVTSSPFIVNNSTSIITNVYNGVNIANGTLALIGFNSSNNAVSNVSTVSVIGTIDVTTGAVIIPNLRVDAYLSNTSLFYFTASPSAKVYYVYNNDILDVNGLTLNINIANN